tara:strand:- start:5955 stop:7217 length:1263 start_codon:yes stop_codon:yes gene_type:complete
MLHEYTISSIIGKGTYGTVFKVYKKNNKKTYAMKKIKINDITNYEKSNIINELRILSAHKCSFIVKFKTSFIEDGCIYFITEYAEKGDLSSIIKQKSSKNIKIEEHIIWNYFLQTCAALCYLHNLKVIHRDIKPANIFIDADDNVKLGDFGVIKMMKSFMMYGQTQIGTPLYMCPEIYKRERYDSKVDCWALGCLLFELMLLKPPFMAENIIDLKKNIFKGNYGSLHVVPYSLVLKNLLMRLLNVYPRQRISVQEIINQPTIRKELDMRHIHILEKPEILSTFYLTCPIPKTVKGWIDVISLFVSLNSTIEPDKDEAENINNLNVAKERLVKINGCKTIDENIQKLKRDIENAKKMLVEFENALSILIKQKKCILESMNNEKNSTTNEGGDKKTNVESINRIPHPPGYKNINKTPRIKRH